MSDSNSLIGVENLKNAIMRAGSNPSMVLQTTIDAVEAASNGTVSFVDASNPVMSVFETSAITHSVSIDQHKASLRKAYAILAQTPEDLYHHMSYRDYINRFASPSTDPFIFFFPESQFFAQALRPTDASYVMVTIPRGTSITVSKYVVFTLQYPINIKYFDSGQFEISYDTTLMSPIQTLTTNMVKPEGFTIPGSADRWIGFTVDAPQVKITKVTDNIQAGKLFAKSYDFTDQFFMARAWYRDDPLGSWVEMATTYSPTVYDVTVPTLHLKVIENSLTVGLPLVYQTSGMVMGDIRVDIYTTKGAEVINLSDYRVGDFITNMQPIDTERDSNEYTSAALGITFTVKSDSIMTGGSDALTFEQLRERVIFNSVGVQQTPITNINIKTSAQNRGFDLVPNIDVVTNRIFLATRVLPKPSDSKLITSANIGITTYTTGDAGSVDNPWVRINGDRTTYLSKNMYQNSNGIIRILPKREVENLKALGAIGKLKAVNEGNYLYSPFYYVLDTSSLELVVRAYHLDAPTSNNLSFEASNPTIQLVVNTGGYKIVKVDTGYKLQIETKSGSFYKALADNEVYAQLAHKLGVSDRRSYWPGVLVGKTAAGERIFEFDIQTNYDLTSDDELITTNSLIDATSSTPVEVQLASKFDIFHITTSITTLYRPSEMDNMIGKFLIPGNSACATHETLNIVLGKSLKRLWTRGRTIPGSEVYERYAADIPEIYAKDEYGTPPFTIENGAIKYNIIGKAGDPVFDVNGSPLFAHRKGDIVHMDGKPVISSIEPAAREFDILTADGRNYFVDDETYIAYNGEFVGVLVDWITRDIPEIQSSALEKTEVYFYPKNQLGTVTLLVDDNTEDEVPSEQSITIDLYVVDEVYRDNKRRDRLTALTIAYLDKWISGLNVSVSAASSELKDIYGTDVKSLKLYGLGADKSIQYAIVTKEQLRMSLKRVLDVQLDGTYIIREDVTINFLKGDPIAPERLIA